MISLWAALNPFRRVNKAWGTELWFINTDYCVKKLWLMPGMRCSRHRHPVKDEVFILADGIAGDVHITIGTISIVPLVGDVVRVPPNTWHSFANYGDTAACLIECSTHHEDDDVERDPSQLSGAI